MFRNHIVGIDLDSKCVGWVGIKFFPGCIVRQTCSRWFPGDKSCDEIITELDEGYCECQGGEQKMVKHWGWNGTFETCNEACKGKIIK